MNSFASWKYYEDFEALNTFIPHCVMSVAQKYPINQDRMSQASQPGETC